MEAQTSDSKLNKINCASPTDTICDTERNLQKPEGEQVVRAKKMELRHSIFALFACSISASNISLLGYQFALTGIVLQIFIMLFSVAFNLYSFYLLVSVSSFQFRIEEILKTESYLDIALKLFGPKVRSIISVLVFICLGGACINIGVFSKNVITELVLSTFPEAPALFKSNTFWAIVVIEGIVLPLSCMRSMKGLSYIAVITAFIVPVILALSIGSFVKNFQHVKISNLNLASTTLSHFLEVFVIFTYNFLVQPSIQSVYLELKDGSLRNKLKSSTISYLFILGPYIAIGLLNYLEFTHSLDTLISTQNIFEIDSFIHWMPIKILTFYCALSPISVVISLILTMKLSILDTQLKSSPHLCLWNMALSLAFTQVILLFSLVLDVVSVATRLTGATIYPIISFVIPALEYLKAEKERTRCAQVNRVLCYVIITSMSLMALQGSLSVGADLTQ